MKRILSLFLILVLLSGCQTISTPATLPPETRPPETTQTPTTTPTIPETTAPAPTETTTVPETAAPEEIEVILTEPAFDPLSFAASLTTEEKVGQLFLARCPETDALADISKYHLGGYILFDRDFRYRTQEEIRELIAAFQQQSGIPMLMAVDEEGGTVTRVSCYSQYSHSNFPSPRELYDQGGLLLVAETEREKCQLLQSLGINVNMAPVCDITTDPNAFMYRRSLGQSLVNTVRFVRTTVDIMDTYKIGSVLKHFPGYGNNADTHTGIAVDERSLEDLEHNDLLPFVAGIRSGCGAVLMSHTFVTALDETLPVSLSPAAHTYLREIMDFHGVIVTDDLVMQAITDLYGAEEAAVMAVLAGNDLLCSSEYQIQYAAVLDAVQTGRISTEQLDQAVARVLQWKYQLGLLSPLSN